MDRLEKLLREIRQKIGKLRKNDLKETPTRTILIDPILEVLGWDVRDPDIVQLEYTTIDGKSVDYALKINEKPVLLVEAKSLGDSLNDVKAITQVVGYASNAGIEWCILTNGILWRVYKSSEKCPAPDKLLFEVNYDIKITKDEEIPKVVRSLCKFSRDEMAKGTLDREGERVFNDGKVKKALDRIFQDPPISFVNLIKKEMLDSSLRDNNKIRESLFRIWSFKDKSIDPPKERKQNRVQKETHFDEANHLKGKKTTVIELYNEIDRFCLSLNPNFIEKSIIQTAINYNHKNSIFCSVVVFKNSLRVYLKLKFAKISDPPDWARDVSSVGHWGNGDVELAIRDNSQLPRAFELIRQSLANS